MADSPEVPESAKIAAYVNRLIAGDFDGKTKQEISDILDIDRKTLWAWNKKVDWAYVTTEKRKLYAQDILEIDQAMMREGKKGNTSAAELAYRRFDGYVPLNALNLGAKSDSELLELLAKKKAELLGGNGQSGSNLPGTGAA